MTAPTWGCPYHGLVQDGKLPLSNGKTMPHPHKHDGSDNAYVGSTTLIKHPLAAAIERSDEEAAEDSKRGWQWWNQAIQGGGFLHGVRLPMLGWIYIDPAGECWLATVDILGASPALTLKRFGVLSGQALSYSYPLVLPDFGQSTPAVQQPSSASAGLTAKIYHATPTGTRAAVELSMDFAGSTFGENEAWRYRPVGWLEVTLSGVGAECKATVTTLYTRAQTLGTGFGGPLTGATEYWWTEDTGSGNYSLGHGPNPPQSWFLYATTMSGTASQGFSAWLVGIHYDAKGERHLTRLSAQTTTTYQLPPLEHEGPDDFRSGDTLVGKWTQRGRVTGTFTVTITYDGSVVATWALQCDEKVEQSAELLEELAGSGKYRGKSVGQVTYSTGDTQTVNAQADVPASSGVIVIGGRYAFVPEATNEPGEIPYSISKRSGRWWRNGASADILLIPQRLSNQVVGAALAFSDQTTWQPEVATPDGAQEVPALIVPFGYALGGSSIYASWCPVTHAVARSRRPVCYT